MTIMNAGNKKQYNNSMKKFNQLISKSSQRLLSSFLNGDDRQQKELEKIKKTVLQAASKKQRVVMQIKTPNNQFETLVGQLLTQSNSTSSVGIRLHPNNELRVVPIDQIKKVRIMSRTATHRNF